MIRLSEIIPSKKANIIDFFADHIRYDYNISDIARYSNVSRPTTYRIIESLIKKKFVIKTRDMRNSPMYKLNLDNKIIQELIRL